MQRVTMTEVYEEIGRWAPWDTAEEWDNVGVLVQGPDEVVTGICCMLDITPEAVAWAAEKRMQPGSVASSGDFFVR